jgi:spermidine/putrescine-binding protein
MKRWRLKSLTAILAAVVLCCGLTFIGCGIEGVDKNKTQLYIGNYSGGIGSEWLNAAKAEFEEKYKDRSFQDGKTGVQIFITNDKSPYLGPNLFATIGVDREEVFFAEYMVNLHDFISGGKLYPITRAVTEKAEGEQRSIEDRLSAEQKDYFKVNGEYYAVPHYETYHSIVYDEGLFDKRLLYFADTGFGNEDGFVRLQDVTYEEHGWVVKNQTSKLSVGPDGVKGTSDDGLPRTYEEFFRLCKKMKDLNIIPLSWTGKHDYLLELLVALWADYEGPEQMSLNFDFEGSAADIVTAIGAGGDPTTAQYDITPQNGYLLSQQAGKYYALKFLEDVVKGSYFSPLSTNLTQDHLAAQRDFIYSDFENKPIAMLVDGTWWENEAKAAFDDCVGEFGARASAANRRFAIFPLPKADMTKLGPQTIYDGGFANAFVNAKIAAYKVDLAYEFIRFCYTEQALLTFTELTGSTKGVSYDLGRINTAKLTSYTRSVIEKKQNSQKFYPYSSADLFRYKQSDFNVRKTWSATIGQTPYNEPFKAFRESRVTAEDFFVNMKVEKAAWDTKYSDFI